MSLLAVNISGSSFYDILIVYLWTFSLQNFQILSQQTGPPLNDPRSGIDDQSGFKYSINITFQNLNERLYIEAYKAEPVMSESRNILNNLKQIDQHLYYGNIEHDLNNVTSIYQIIIEIRESKINVMFSSDSFHYLIRPNKLGEIHDSISSSNKIAQHRLIVMNKTNVDLNGEFLIVRNEIIREIIITQVNFSKSVRKRNAKLQYIIEASIHVPDQDNDPLNFYILYIIAQVNQIMKYPKLNTDIKIVIENIYNYWDDLVNKTNVEKTYLQFTQLKYRFMHDLDLSILITSQMTNLTLDGTSGIGISGLRDMCSPGLSVLITRYNWFETASSIAHEIGHLLEAVHDMDTSCNSFIKRGIMHYESTGIRRNQWSECSSLNITNFLRTQSASCLLFNNIEHGLRGLVDLPGLDIFNEQCGFYPNYIIRKDSNCGTLICMVRGTITIMSEPPLEGTPCQVNANNTVSLTPLKHYRLCFRGICMRKSQIGKSFDLWGSWGEWTLVPAGDYSFRNRTCLAQEQALCYGNAWQGTIREV